MAVKKDFAARWAEVTDNWAEKLSDDALREMAGEDLFERGHAYFSAGKVSMPRDGGGNATFTVKGTQTYSTELYFEDVGLHTACTCPHAQEGAFCKHMVAAGLFWRCKLEGNAAPALANTAQTAIKSIASQKRQATVASKRDALKAFVFAQDATSLAEKLWQLAETDRDMMAVLKSWHAQSVAVQEPGGWKDAIATMLEKSRSFYGWAESNAYARRAEAVYPLLERIAHASPEQGRAACAYALRKLYKVGEHADDSGGMIGDLMYGVQALLLKTLKAAPPPAQWLDEWFALMEADPWGLWRESDVLEVAGPLVQKRYSERVQADWLACVQSMSEQTSFDAQGKRKARSLIFTGVSGGWDAERSKLRRRYIEDLKRQGDDAAVLQALSASLKEAHEHSELIAWCESMNKMREALDYALKARKLFPQDWRIQDDLLRCYERDGWDAEALAIHRTRLEHNPSPEKFDAVLKAAVAAGHDRQTYRASLYEWVAEREVQDAKFKPSRLSFSRPTNTGRSVTTRATWLLHESKTDEALALVQPPHACDDKLLYTLAKKIRDTKPAEALALLHRVFAARMPQASTPYTDVLELVAQVASLMKQPDHGQWLARLRAEYKAKRNFIKGLDALKL